MRMDAPDAYFYNSGIVHDVAFVRSITLKRSLIRCSLFLLFFHFPCPTETGLWCKSSPTPKKCSSASIKANTSSDVSRRTTHGSSFWWRVFTIDWATKLPHYCCLKLLRPIRGHAAASSHPRSTLPFLPWNSTRSSTLLPPRLCVNSRLPLDPVPGIPPPRVLPVVLDPVPYCIRTTPHPRKHGFLRRTRKPTCLSKASDRDLPRTGIRVASSVWAPPFPFCYPPTFHKLFKPTGIRYTVQRTNPKNRMFLRCLSLKKKTL
jgi:hypothetical protein